ncbi:MULTISPECIES: hypothetical protein [unclassified Streptomyces]|uniref:hypothetical protein n=1 Tax=unclassified Streptomyces TaxID=2593676 RepID=UPI0033AA28A1
MNEPSGYPSLGRPLHRGGEHPIADLAALLSADRAKVFRVPERHRTSGTPSTPGRQ